MTATNGVENGGAWFLVGPNGRPFGTDDLPVATTEGYRSVGAHNGKPFEMKIRGRSFVAEPKDQSGPGYYDSAGRWISTQGGSSTLPETNVNVNGNSTTLPKADVDGSPTRLNPVPKKGWLSTGRDAHQVPQRTYETGVTALPDPDVLMKNIENAVGPIALPGILVGLGALDGMIFKFAVGKLVVGVISWPLRVLLNRK